LHGRLVRESLMANMPKPMPAKSASQSHTLGEKPGISIWWTSTAAPITAAKRARTPGRQRSDQANAMYRAAKTTPWANLSQLLYQARTGGYKAMAYASASTTITNAKRHGLAIFILCVMPEPVPGAKSTSIPSVPSSCQ